MLLLPRPTSAATNQSQVLRDKAKDPFKIEPAWERELLSVFRRCCCERSLTGVCVCMLVRGGGGEPLGVYYSHIYVCIYIHIYICTCMYTYVCCHEGFLTSVCLVCEWLCVLGGWAALRLYVCIYVHIRIYIYISTFIHVNTYIYIYVRIAAVGGKAF